MGRQFRLVAKAAAALVAGACAAGTRGPAASRCVPEAIDSVWAATGPVYRNCEVDRAARYENAQSVRLDYTPSRDCETVLFDFVVDTTGTVEARTARVVRGNSPPLAQAMVATFPRMRYSPAIKDGVRVRQVVEQGAALRRFVSRPGTMEAPRTHTPGGCIP